MLAKSISWNYSPAFVGDEWAWFSSQTQQMLAPFFNGGDVHDYSRRRVNGLLVGSAVWAEGKTGRVVLTGAAASNRIQVFNGSGCGTFTGTPDNWMAYFHVESTGAAGTRRVLMADWDTAGTNESMFVEITSGNQWRAGSRNFTLHIITVTPTVTVGADTVVFLQFERGVALTLWVYENGVLLGTATTVIDDNTLDSGSAAYLGSGGDFTGNIGWVGHISHFGWDNRVWESSQREQWSRYPSGPFRMAARRRAYRAPSAVAATDQLLLSTRGRYGSMNVLSGGFGA